MLTLGFQQSLYLSELSRLIQLSNCLTVDMRVCHGSHLYKACGHAQSQDCTTRSKIPKGMSSSVAITILVSESIITNGLVITDCIITNWLRIIEIGIAYTMTVTLTDILIMHLLRLGLLCKRVLCHHLIALGPHEPWSTLFTWAF